MPKILEPFETVCRLLLTKGSLGIRDLAELREKYGEDLDLVLHSLESSGVAETRSGALVIKNPDFARKLAESALGRPVSANKAILMLQNQCPTVFEYGYLENSDTFVLRFPLGDFLSDLMRNSALFKAYATLADSGVKYLKIGEFKYRVKVVKWTKATLEAVFAKRGEVYEGLPEEIDIARGYLKAKLKAEIEVYSPAEALGEEYSASIYLTPVKT